MPTDTKVTTDADVASAVRFLHEENEKNVNSFTGIKRDLHGMWGAQGIFAHRGGISFADSIIAAARALGWKSDSDEEPTDEQVAANALANMRAEARETRHAATTRTNTDARAVLEGAAEQRLAEARALHRLLLKAGVKGLGPINY